MVEIFGYGIPWQALIPALLAGIMVWIFTSWLCVVYADGAGWENPAYTLWVDDGVDPRWIVFSLRVLELVVGWPAWLLAKIIRGLFDLVRWLRAPTKSS